MSDTRPIRTLRDTVRNIDALDDGLTIYACGSWNPSAAVVLAYEPESGGLPPLAEAAGARYFLEVFIAKEVLASVAALDLEARTARLIQYAVDDA